MRVPRRRARRFSVAAIFAWGAVRGMICPAMEDLAQGTPVSVLGISGEVASGKVVSTDPLESLPGSSSYVVPTLGEGNVLVQLENLRRGAASVELADPCHPRRHNLGQYQPMEVVVLPLVWLRIYPVDSAKYGGGQELQPPAVEAAGVPGPQGRVKRGGRQQQQLASAAAVAPAVEGRPKRAAAEGVEMMLMALRGGIAADSPMRNGPHRAAAAGVQRATAAAADSSSGMSTERGLLEELAVAAEETAEESAMVAAEEVATASPMPARPRPKRKALAEAWDHVDAAQPRNYRRIEGQRRAKGVDKDFQRGDLVYLRIPQGVPAPPCGPRKVLCRVLDVDNRGLLLLRCNAGVLDHRYPATDADVAPPMAVTRLVFEGLYQRGVPKVPIAAAVAAECGGVAAVVQCRCRKGCGTRCKCRQKGQQCSRQCKCMCGQDSNCGNY